MIKTSLLLILVGFTPAHAKDPVYPDLKNRKPSPGNATYFVDPANGDDQNAGTADAKPWRTFHRLNQLRLAPGDTVHLSPGTFDHSLVLSGSGSPDAPVQIEFAPGTYHFHPNHAYREAYQISNTNAEPDKTKAVAILLRHAKHFQITGPEALALYRGKMMEVCIDHCEDITLSGLSFDYHRPTVSEWQVTAVADDHAKLKIHPDSTYRIENNQLVWVGEGWIETTGLAQILNPETGAVRRLRDPLKGLSFEELKPGLLKATGKHRLQSGKIYQIRNPFRDYAAVFIRRSKNIIWKDTHFRFLHGMGIVNQFSENLTYQKVRIAPDPKSGRTTAAWADGMQFSGCRGQIRILDCHFSGTHDDAINIHGTHLKVTEVLSKTEIKVRFMHKQSFGFPAFNAGDEVDFVARETLATYGTNQIKIASLVSPREIKLTLAKPLPPEFQLNDALENVTWTPAVEIRGCKVERTPTRGFLITTRRKSIIADNEFHATHMGAILIENDASGWYESGCVRDLTISNNRFFFCRPPVIEIDPKNKKSNPSVHQNIRIDHNTFHLHRGPVLAAKSTTDLSFTNNIIHSKEAITRDNLVKIHDAPPALIQGTQLRITGP